MNKDVVNSVRTAIKNSKFNGAIRIEYNSEPILSEAYGYSNFEHDVLNKVDTKFRIASVTKQFTATAIMQMYDKELLRLDDSIDKYIPDYPKGDEITIHNILAHTAGINDFEIEYDFYDVLRSDSVLNALIDLFKYKPLQFEPGTKFSYSISGFLILQYIIESISKMKYIDYLKEYILEPLGMHNTGFDYYRDIVKNRANCYEMKDNVIENSETFDMRIAGAGGGLYSTVEDLSIFNHALKSGKIISEKSVELMFTKQFVIAEGAYSGYGIIMEEREFFGKVRRVNYHFGAGNGVRSLNEYYPDDNIDIIAISNVNDKDTFNSVIKGIEKILLS